MGIPEVLDDVIEPHGHRQGLSHGWLATVWLSYILSETDHRMNQVERWAEGRLESLRALVPGDVTVKDFTDDRLADSQRALSDDVAWEEIERQLSQRLVRVYDLSSETVRLDNTTVSVHHDPRQSPDGDTGTAAQTQRLFARSSAWHQVVAPAAPKSSCQGPDKGESALRSARLFNCKRA